MTDAEKLAQWYFRLNGCLTIPNFVLHPVKPGSARTDVDIVGLRFPNRRELSDGVIDDEPFRKQVQPWLVLAEVKTCYMSLNQTWTVNSGSNIASVLAAIGFVGSQRTEAVARTLAGCGVWNDERISCSLFFVGDCLPKELAQQYVDVPYRTWSQVLAFVYDRFKRFDRLKTDHDQWDSTGKTLWDLSAGFKNLSAFEIGARNAFSLRTDVAAQ